MRLPGGRRAILDLSKIEDYCLNLVALLADLPEPGLARGQVGTIVEVFDDATYLVEFSDDQGQAYAFAPCAKSQLLVLHYVPQAA